MLKNGLNKDNILTEGASLSYPDSVIDFFKGMMGQPAWGFPEDLQKVVLKGEEPITCRPADLLKPEFDTMKEEVKQYVENASVEDVLTYAMFPKVAPKFFEKRRDRQVGIDADHADKTNKVHPV